MTELQLRQKCVSVAKSFLGKKEADGSHKVIIDDYNKIKPLPRGYKMKYTDPWCAAFVSAVSYLCGFLSVMPAECGCDAMINLYKKMGRWEENDAYDADIGDVIFYDWQDSGSGNNKGSSDHVGIVIAKDSKGFTVIEGNKSDKVDTRYIKKNGKYIRGFGLPAYSVLSDENPEIPVVDDSENQVISVNKDSPEIIVKDTVTIQLPELSYGDGIDKPNSTVEAAQLLLIGRHYSCGGAGADGEFGNGTLAGVKNYQSANGLKATGVIESNTWASLLGLK